LLTGIAVEVWALPEKEISSRVRKAVQGVIRDVLDQVGQEGRARTLSLALTVTAHGLRLTVSNDDGGLPGEAFEERLRGRRTELAELDGRLTINGVQGEGTTVDVVVPRKTIDG
jgi:signal transduction histidine kinase